MRRTPGSLLLWCIELLTPAGAEWIAVCLFGRVRGARVVGEALRQNLLDPLCGGSCAAEAPQHRVDVYIAGPATSGSPLRGTADLLDAQGFPWLVKGVRFQDESHILSYLNTPENIDNWHKTLLIRGNWIGAASKLMSKRRIHRRRGSGLWQYFAQHQCLEMIEGQERFAATSYDRLVLSRTDLKWIFPHPPPHALDRTLAWIPDTMEDDWGGIYDRHYVLPRSLLRAGLGGWEMLVDGRAWRLMATGADVMLPGSNVSMNTETYLALRLEYAGAQIARYPATAYLACDSSEWKDGKTGMSQGGSRTVHGAVSVNFSCQPGGYRYPLEYEAATNFADCMEKEDGRNRWQASVRACICKYMSLEDAERTGYGPLCVPN